MQVVVDKLLTNYETTGEGESILLLHGWGDNIKGLAQLRSALSKDYQVIALDLPGFGGSQAPPKPWGLNNYSKFVADFLKKINNKDVYAIVAHSNGGAIAIRALGSGLLSVKKCVLLGSAGIRGVYKGRVKVIRMITKAGKAITAPLPKATKEKLRRGVYKTVGSDMLVAEHLQETFKKVVSDDVRADAAKIDVPVLLIYGENDTQAPPSYGLQFHEIMSDSTLEIVGGAGHFVHIDKPDQVNKLIKDFIK
jgi:pimeloyl-ACP methyl ester carboxylesterase